MSPLHEVSYEVKNKIMKVTLFLPVTIYAWICCHLLATNQVELHSTIDNTCFVQN